MTGESEEQAIASEEDMANRAERIISMRQTLSPDAQTPRPSGSGSVSDSATVADREAVYRQLFGTEV